MKVKWFGHACFLLTSDNGVKIVTDPFDDTIGYELPEVEADIVTSSHNHYDHNNKDIIKGDFLFLNKPGTFSSKGIEITGITTYHDEVKGNARGTNIIFKYNIDGIQVCHCGDLGHVLAVEQISELGRVDILLIPVGGTYTVDAEKATEVVKQLNPSITIPMHFKTEALAFKIDGVDNFLNAGGDWERAGLQELEINRDNLSEYSKILVLDYKDNQL